ncbi:MAG TPA: hypothetical protein VI457_03405 [Methylococcaceae bacterium]|nr:hypothetical protein [Methylococcaceae bacterium]
MAGEEIAIAHLSLEHLRADQTGTLIGQWARLAYASFRPPPR